ncbi:cob(I)yrinic acid a,c-diamide adenosyltransferase [Desulfitobacterium sp.]|uniref:cob(I)yrinic acid a,c-diamide adenosyltransferase n=1 Tax=Desulfitobacterium sp. TaxID=49981 RepID=UPI002B20BFCB|nr:cob(I)yrinic acid a,c-diamide adenosyltransferase [Desulfitobacterium sp.]MEA4902828.1 cob(I)yrinic acid a,c-diamide adenosyltransferase [Desulfitobacterium sp.]
MPKLDQGLVQIYTGPSKGKTTAALGLAVRAVGHGFHVYIIQFMKGADNYGELTGIQRLAPECRLEHFGTGQWVHKGKARQEDIEEAQKALRCAREIMRSGQWDILILDEIINAIWFELLAEDEVLKFIEEKPAQVELILTGRNASERLIEKANLVTEMVQIKHPYEQGINARKGIEY